MPIKRKQWDGPRNSQGYLYSWPALSSILRMSIVAGRHRQDIEEWRKFLDANPLIRDDIVYRINHDNVPRSKLVEHLLDLMKRSVEEGQRRLTALRGRQ